MFPRCAWAALLAWVPGCSLLLDFDDPGDGVTIDASTTPDAAQLCDAFEPNNNQTQAIAVENGSFPAAICPKGDRDWYAFTVDGAQDATIEIMFDNRMGLGDLDMLLYTAGGAVLEPRANGAEDVETIERTATSALCTGPSMLCRLEAGTYGIEVYAFDNRRENNYTFTLTLVPPTSMIPDAGLPDV
jgi:hypothetical protein